MSGHSETHTAPQPLPLHHELVPMGTRVKLPESYTDEETWGEVQGVAATGLSWGYIVLLDAPLEISVGEVRAVVVWGPDLEGEGGVHWRRTLQQG